ncbi:MAG: DUF169 domain-containing protein [bacterium]
MVEPSPGKQVCVFSFFENWLKGETLLIRKDNFGCKGAGHSLCNASTRSVDDLVKFLVDGEGLKSSRDLMRQWIGHQNPYIQNYPNILIGPLRERQYDFLKTVTFFVNPDQLSVLMLGAQYNTAPGDPPPVLAPFGSGCMELVSLFGNLSIPQAIIGSTDVAMRQFIPQNILAFTVTKPLFRQLCELDEKSFLHKPFWKNLRKSRKIQTSKNPATE